MRCSFTDMCGFTQGSEDKFDWTTAAQATPTANTGPLRGSGEYGKGGGMIWIGWPVIGACPRTKLPQTMLALMDVGQREDGFHRTTCNRGKPTDKSDPAIASFDEYGKGRGRLELDEVEELKATYWPTSGDKLEELLDQSFQQHFHHHRGGGHLSVL